MNTILNQLTLMFSSFVTEYGVDGTLGIGFGTLICFCIIGIAYRK